MTGGDLALGLSPQTVPGQELAGVGVGVEGDGLLLREHAQLLGNHTAALQVDLPEDERTVSDVMM